MVRGYATEWTLGLLQEVAGRFQVDPVGHLVSQETKPPGWSPLQAGRDDSNQLRLVIS